MIDESPEPNRELYQAMTTAALTIYRHALILDRAAARRRPRLASASRTAAFCNAHLPVIDAVLAARGVSSRRQPTPHVKP